MEFMFRSMSPERTPSTDWRFKVEKWNEKGCIEKELALCENLMCAIAAFDAAVREFPNATLTMRQGIRVLREHPPRTPPGTPEAARPVSLHVVRAKRD